MTTVTFKQPYPGQAFDGSDLTHVEVKPVTTKTLRTTATITNMELREYAIIKQVTGLTDGQFDQLVPEDLEALQAVVRPLLPGSLTAGLTLSHLSLSSAILEQLNSTPSPAMTLPGGPAA